MKRLGLFGIIGIVVIIIIAAVTAGKMGETSHAIARGKIVLSDDLVDKAKGIHTLFIIVSGNDRPMPLGAMRKTVGDDLKGEIYEFALTNEAMQRMDMNTPWPEEFRLKARLDQDGQGGMDQPGDLVGILEHVKLGSEGLVLKIDRVM